MVLADRPPDRAAEFVLSRRRLHLRKESASVQFFIAEELERATVELVGSALQCKAGHARQSVPVLGGIIGGGELELVDGVHGGAVLRVVVRAGVHRSTVKVDGICKGQAAANVLFPCAPRNSRRQEDEARCTPEIASQGKRQVQEFVLVYHNSNFGGVGREHGRRGVDRNLFLHLPNLQLKVHTCGLADLDGDSLADVALESRYADLERVIADAQKRNRVCTGIARFRRGLDPCAFVQDDYLGIRDHLPARIGHGSSDGPAITLSQ